jgi:hypothetical protein
MNKRASVMLSPFAPLRTVLSEAKELRINSAKHLLFFTFRSRFFVASLLRMTGLG